MASATQVIFAGEIDVAKSILGIFNGTEAYAIANKYFPKETGYNSKHDDLSTRMASKSDKGFRLKAPTILMRNKNGKLDKWFIIAWTADKGSQKDYFFKAPDSKVNIDEIFKRKRVDLYVSPNSRRDDVREDDERLAAMDYQLIMATQVLLFANLFGVNLSAYTEEDNKAFFSRFEKEINGIMEGATGKKGSLSFDDAMIESFTNIPTYGRMENKLLVPAVAEIQEDEEVLKPAFNSIWDSVKRAFSKQLGNPSKYLSSLKIPTDLTSIVSAINYCPIPSAVRKFVKFGENYETAFDLRVRIRPKLDESGGWSRYTRQKISKDKTINLTRDGTYKLWGGSKSSPRPQGKRGESFEGKIFFKPELDLMYFPQGSPTMRWEVDKLSIQKKRVETIDDYDGGEEYYDESEGEGIPSKLGATLSTGDSDEDDGYSSPY